MLKRAMIALACLGLVLGFAPAANAYYSNNICDTAHNLGVAPYEFTGVVCYQVDYRLQNDGSGIHVNGIYVDLNQGCDSFSTDGFPIFKNLFAGTRKNDGTKWKETVSPVNMEDCHAYRTININGPDNGEAVLNFSMTMDISLAPDEDFGILCTLHTNGSGTCSLSPNVP